MVIKLASLSLFVVLSTTVCHSESVGTDGPVKDIIIEGNGLYAGEIGSDESKSSCADFRLQEEDVREFFVSARALTQREYSHELSGSNCYVSGRLTDMSGMKQWRIDRARRGLIIDPNGNAAYLYCKTCASEIYYEPCDLECENSP
jgi:hypothetical protein